MANTKKALVSGRILKRSGHVVVRGPHSTVHRSTAPQWEGSVRGALDSAADALIEHSTDMNGVLDFDVNGRRYA